MSVNIYRKTVETNTRWYIRLNPNGLSKNTWHGISRKFILGKKTRLSLRFGRCFAGSFLIYTTHFRLLGDVWKGRAQEHTLSKMSTNVPLKQNQPKKARSQWPWMEMTERFEGDPPFHSQLGWKWPSPSDINPLTICWGFVSSRRIAAITPLMLIQVLGSQHLQKHPKQKKLPKTPPSKPWQCDKNCWQPTYQCFFEISPWILIAGTTNAKRTPGPYCSPLMA